jgi:hypothetical protein
VWEVSKSLEERNECFSNVFIVGEDGHWIEIKEIPFEDHALSSVPLNISTNTSQLSAYSIITNKFPGLSGVGAYTSPITRLGDLGR